ncbi:avidin-related protein 4/5-like isoform X2 [Glandiceps talaboti]
MLTCYVKSSSSKYINRTKWLDPKLHARALNREDPTCSVAGYWKNELGSIMKLIVAQDGSLSGYYNTSVGHPGAETQPIHGFTDPSGSTIGFTVSWRNGESQTSWTGEYFCEPDEIIQTMWILTEAGKQQDYWGANLIGQDDFRRIRELELKRDDTLRFGFLSLEHLLHK